MQPLVLLGEVAGLTVVVCLLHALKPRLGLIPLYLAVGLFEAFLFVAGKPTINISAELFFTQPANISYSVFLPLILSSAVLVYVLEGTQEARRLMIALITLYFLHGVIDVIVEYHASHPPPGGVDQSKIDVVRYSMESRFASLVAMMADFIVILVGYQFVVNRLPRFPLLVPVFLATVAALATDSIFYSLARGRLFTWEKVLLIEKLQTGIAAAIPLSIYLAWQLYKHRDDVQAGILNRGAFEIVALRRKVQEVTEKLKEQRAQYAYIKGTFSRYVSPEVVETLLKDPAKIKLGGELRNVTVLFADIRGYSTLSESLDPEEVITILNRYFQRVTDVILARGGMINEFEGDAVLAVFGAPLNLDKHALCAIQAGVDMLAAVRDLNAEWDADGTSTAWHSVGIDELAIRIGIHSGVVVAGNIGSTTRIKYAVIGDTVNTASRVEALNKETNTSLLVTDATLRKLEKHHIELPFEFVGRYALKGRSEPVRVYTIPPDEMASLSGRDQSGG